MFFVFALSLEGALEEFIADAAAAGEEVAVLAPGFGGAEDEEGDE